MTDQDWLCKISKNLGEINEKLRNVEKHIEKHSNCPWFNIDPKTIGIKRVTWFASGFAVAITGIVVGLYKAIILLTK